MKKKKLFCIFVILAIIVLLISSIIYVYISITNNSKIPNGYIAIFHGGAGEITYETYIYKKDNGQANSDFVFINVTNTTKSWGSRKWKSKITKRGSVQSNDDVFKIAKENGAYSYVTLPNNDKIYTIEQYMSMFLMN